MSYDSGWKLNSSSCIIERSPDHWWVTTWLQHPCRRTYRLKGHQIIGELRRANLFWASGERYWKVTRSLVSYDFIRLIFNDLYILKGHQIIGELRRLVWQHPLILHDWKVTRSLVSYDLIKKYLMQLKLQLKGHQIIGELRQVNWAHRISIGIERSPDHWWVTTF